MSSCSATTTSQGFASDLKGDLTATGHGLARVAALLVGQRLVFALLIADDGHVSSP